MSEYITVAKTSEIPEGQGRPFELEGQIVAIFNLGGEFAALDDTCPHAGAPLSEGYVEEGAVTCPWHAWRFDCKTGDWCDAPGGKVHVEAFDVRVEGDEIQLRKKEQ